MEAGDLGNEAEELRDRYVLDIYGVLGLKARKRHTFFIMRKICFFWGYLMVSEV